MTSLSYSHEVMRRILDGEGLKEEDERKISVAMRHYKTDVRARFCGVLTEEYIGEIDEFLRLMSIDPNKLPSWFMSETKFKMLRLGIFNLVVEALSGFDSYIYF